MHVEIYAILPSMLLALVELEDGITGDNEKRRALKDFFESDHPLCETVIHDAFGQYSTVIPNMQTLNLYKDFQQRAGKVGLHISDVDLLSIVCKVHPDLTDCTGKPQSDFLRILQGHRQRHT